MSRTGDAGFPAAAAILLGVGLGGLFDGIVFHQLLQWHRMARNASVADGVFHAAMWILVVVAVFLLWQRANRPHTPWPTRALVGSLLIGFGAFNVVAGLFYPLGFVAVGALMLAAGWYLKRARRVARPKPALERRQRPMRWRPGDRRAYKGMHPSP